MNMFCCWKCWWQFLGLWLWCLMPLSTIFQLYHVGHFEKKPKYLKKTTNMQVTDNPLWHTVVSSSHLYGVPRKKNPSTFHKTLKKTIMAYSCIQYTSPRSNRRKPPTCCKSLTNFYGIQLYLVHISTEYPEKTIDPPQVT